MPTQIGSNSTVGAITWRGVGNILIVDAENGNNNDPSKPYSTIAGALAAAQSGDTCVINPGSYTSSASITIPSGVSLFGFGWSNTSIEITGGGNAVILTGGHSIDGIRFIHSAATGAALRVDNDASGAITIHRCKLDATVDALQLLANADISVYDTLMTSGFDCLYTGETLTTGIVRLYNCKLTSDGPVSGAPSRAAAIYGGTVEFWNCHLLGIDADTGAVATSIFMSDGDGGTPTVRVKNSRLEVSTTLGTCTPINIENSGSITLRLYGNELCGGTTNSIVSDSAITVRGWGNAYKLALHANVTLAGGTLTAGSNAIDPNLS